jgi:hypothetical protein
MTTYKYEYESRCVVSVKDTSDVAYPEHTDIIIRLPGEICLVKYYFSFSDKTIGDLIEIFAGASRRSDYTPHEIRKGQVSLNYKKVNKSDSAASIKTESTMHIYPPLNNY